MSGQTIVGTTIVRGNFSPFRERRGLPNEWNATTLLLWLRRRAKIDVLRDVMQKAK
jgi:hypothetical protein